MQVTAQLNVRSVFGHALLVIFFVFSCQTSGHASDFADSFHALAERHYVATGNDYYALTNSQGAPPNIHGQRLQASSGGDFYDDDFILGGPARAVVLVQALKSAVYGVSTNFIEQPTFPESGTTYYQTRSLGYSLPTIAVDVNTLPSAHRTLKGLIQKMRFLDVGFSRPRHRYRQASVGYYQGGTQFTPGGLEPCGPLYFSPSSAFSAAMGHLSTTVEIESGWGDSVGMTGSTIWTIGGPYTRTSPCCDPPETYKPGELFTAQVIQREYNLTADVSRITGSVDLYLRFDKTPPNQPGAAPGSLDGRYHVYKNFSGGGAINEWIGVGIQPTMPTGTPTLGNEIATASVMRNPYLIADCTFTKNPGSLPFFPPIAPPPTCPVGQGWKTDGGSIIDNLQLSHIHDASDFGEARTALASCGSCGSVGSDDGKLPSLAWRRFHRYRDQDQFGHFGPGVFSNFDVRVQLDTATNSMTLWDAQNPLELELQEGATAGTYSDARWSQIHSAELLDAAGLHATDDTTARWVELRTWEGRRYRFELFSLRTGDTGTRAGRLISITDRNGNALTLTYTDAVTATDAALGHDRSRLWRIASIVDAYGRTATLTWMPYLGAWVVESISVPNGSTIFYDYNRSGLIGLNRVRHPDGAVSTFSTSADVANQLQVISIDDAGCEDIHRRKTSHVTWSSMDSQHVIPSLSGSVPVAPNRIRMVKNGAGEVSYQNWGQSNASVYAAYVYEGGKSASDPGTLMRYETVGGAPFRISRATSFTITGWQWSAAAWEILEEYDAAADTRINRLVDNQRRISTFTRNSAGSITGTTITAANAFTPIQSTSASYNAFEQPTVTTDGLGRSTEYTYDANGNRLTKKAAPNLPEESLWSWTYNGRGQPLTSTDANGNVTTYVYGEVVGANDYKRLISILEPADVIGGPRATTLFTYDSVGRLKTVTDAANRVTTYNYDSRNRMSSMVYADSSTETWTYGATPLTANLVVSHKDRNNNVETFTYDAAGRRTSLTLAGPGGTPVVGTQSWTYLPGKALIKTAIEDGELTTYGYDHHLRQVSTTRYPRAGAVLTTSIVYDQFQRVAFTQDPYGRRTYFGYDYQNQVSRTARELVAGALTIPGDDAQSIINARGIVRSLVPNPGYVIEEQVYDREGQVLQRIDGRGYRSIFEYDAQGRLTAQVQSANLSIYDPSPGQVMTWAWQWIWENGQEVYRYVCLGYRPRQSARNSATMRKATASR